MSAFSAEPVLARLKDFQRLTVDHVFERLYLDQPGTRRFLVADEVGLGKTMVARGVIARMLEHLDDQPNRIDIIYVCSNAAIAEQNVKRLNVLGNNEFARASRLTLLPTEVHGLKKNRVNFISFTPGTTLDLKSSGGIKKERVVIYRMLKGEAWLDPSGLLNFLRHHVGRANWEWSAKSDDSFHVDETLSAAFREDIRQDKELRGRLIDICERFHRFKENPEADRPDQNALLGDLRKRLSKICLEALEPDLIILDEFQRFRNLLQSGDAAAELAQDLFNYKDARVLLLSATPYKMLSLDHEQEDDHYPDFLKTLEFLLGSPAEVVQIERQISDFRRELLDISPDHACGAKAAREALQESLRAVMCRTERVSMTARHDAMLVEPPRHLTLKPDDLKHAALIDAVSRAVGARDAIEYWKSAPYALNFMKEYELRHKLEKLPSKDKAPVVAALDQHAGQLLTRNSFRDYETVEAANPRLRALFEDTLEQGLWRVLWLPPSLPSWQPAGPFVGIDKATKSLVFSAWNVVPDAIAALCSYEAERRMLGALDRAELTHDTLYDRIKPLLRFAKDAEGHRLGMPALLLQYPSPTLASLVDPVQLGLDHGLQGLPSLEVIREEVVRRLTPIIEPFTSCSLRDGREDERWYWVLPALMDRAKYQGMREWCAGTWRESADTGDAETQGSNFQDHVDQFLLAMDGGMTSDLGRPPDDLVSVLTDLCLSGPAICALRSLRRVAMDLAWDAPPLVTAATQVAVGFRTLFNVPESIALLRGDNAGEAYWRITLQHGLDGNLPALLDEQIHVLRESLGLVDEVSEKRASGIAKELSESLSIRTSQLSLDELTPGVDGAGVGISSFRLRCRFALRFGELRDEKAEARIETVRSAFNSPFRPFILASTSVGQEGLDFHTWCHAVVHWNLPSNPVDLEQREGRVHRYKGHAVRKNVAQLLGMESLREDWLPGNDPWEVLFAKARQQRNSDLLTYWLFETEGGARIERRVPLLPMSRDGAQLARLKRGLALYRLVFGQPRQEDLLAHLSDRLPPEDIDRVVNEWRIDLSPPK